MTAEKAPQRISFRRLEPGEMPAVPAMGDMHAERPRVVVGGRIGPSAGGGGMGGTRASVPPVGGRPVYDYSVGGLLIPSRGGMGPDAVFGASLISLKPELATALKLEMGVLVEQVPEETPAYKAGLRAGDVITNVAGVSVSTVREVRVLSVTRGAESRSISLQIVRDKKPKQLTVKW
jgi:membrane-associated protease RseP (regulator of RpoE activity)